MRVAFFVNRFPVLTEAFVATSAAALIGSGHDVEIFGFGGGEATGFSVDGQTAETLHGRYRNAIVPTTVAGHLRAAPRALARTVRAAGWRTLGALNPLVHRRSVRNLTSLYQAAALGRNRRYDILHCQFATLGEFVLKHRQAGLLDGSVVVHFRGYDISEVVETCGPHVYDGLFAGAQHFIANCEYFRSKAIDLGCDPGRITVIGSGIDLANFPYRDPIATAGGPIRFASIGRLIERKGVHVALEALAGLAADGTDFRFDVIGDGDMRRELERMARDLCIADRVTFHGGRPHSEIRTILEDCHVFLATSMTARDGGVDATVNTIKEAMAIGVPVVGTRHGGIPELVEDSVTGALANENDPQDLTDAIRRLIALEPRWTDIAREGRRRVERIFAIEVTNQKLIDVYEKVVAAKGP